MSYFLPLVRHQGQELFLVVARDHPATKATNIPGANHQSSDQFFDTLVLSLVLVLTCPEIFLSLPNCTIWSTCFSDNRTTVSLRDEPIELLLVHKMTNLVSLFIHELGALSCAKESMRRSGRQKWLGRLNQSAGGVLLTLY